MRITPAKTDKAKLIRQHLMVDPYTATQLGHGLVAVALLESQLLAERDLADAIDLALTPASKRPSTVEELRSSLSLLGLHKEASRYSARPRFLKHHQAP